MFRLKKVPNVGRPDSVSIVIPTRLRPNYLTVALESVSHQAKRIDAEITVVDDDPLVTNQRLANQYGAKYIPHTRPQGLNAARNTGIQTTTGELIIFVDDDIRAHDNWLAELMTTVRQQPNVGVFGGPIQAIFESSKIRICKPECVSITSLNLGNNNCNAKFVWGANMAVRRNEFDRVGLFNPNLLSCGDEEDWLIRYRKLGGEIHYVAKATIEHRRCGNDAKLASLSRAAYKRGRSSRQFDRYKNASPTIKAELRTLVGCIWHIGRHRCSNGIVLTAHTMGRLFEAIVPLGK